MLESHPVVLAAAWIAEHVAHPERLLLLVAGAAALGSFWIRSALRIARVDDARARELTPAGDDLI